MENLQNNCFTEKVSLHEAESLRSKKLEKTCLLTFTKENDNFKISAKVDDKEFLANLSMVDWVNMKEKNFIHKVHNFKLLLKTLKKGLKKNKVTVSQLQTSLKLTLFYTIVFDKEKISFELKPKSSEENEKETKEEEKTSEIRNEDYKAEIIEYSKDIEDFGDRNILKAVVENKGSCYWPKGKTSFTSIPEFSSLTCQEYVLDDDVMPGEQIEIYLEFLKNGKKCSRKQCFTCLNLNICQEKIGPMLLLDFNNPNSSENVDENVDENEKDNESEVIDDSSEENKENKVDTTTFQKEENNKEEVKKEEVQKEEKKEDIKEEVQKEEKKEDDKEKQKEKKDTIEKVEVKEKEKVEKKEEVKEKENIEKKEDVKEKENIEKKEEVKEKEKVEKKEDVKEKKELGKEDIEKMSLVQKRIYELNKLEKERLENEAEIKKKQSFNKNK